MLSITLFQKAGESLQVHAIKHADWGPSGLSQNAKLHCQHDCAHLTTLPLHFHNLVCKPISKLA